MDPVQPQSDPSHYVPDVDGLTLAEAALAYASAGWFVLPVSPGTKNPGGVVGGEWQRQSTRDPKQIEQWWDENPDYGIALHVGKSGAIVFDLDVEDLNELPGEMRGGLRKGRFQSTRNGANDRGHYVFAVPAGESYGNGAGAFRTFGEVRGKNGVIIAAPTPHVDADTKGGGDL
ncbi:bifunctional DNA primase/polymerase, partial [Rhodococcus sp. P14]|uniref:bifunctional DNA primase/polymerase n=1 Tax=Rhodococcus sp. P14 TaxID=450821 RepID=UPI00178C5737